MSLLPFFLDVFQCDFDKGFCGFQRAIADFNWALMSYSTSSSHTGPSNDMSGDGELYSLLFEEKERCRNYSHLIPLNNSDLLNVLAQTDCAKYFRDASFNRWSGELESVKWYYYGKTVDILFRLNPLVILDILVWLMSEYFTLANSRRFCSSMWKVCNSISF